MESSNLPQVYLQVIVIFMILWNVECKQEASILRQLTSTISYNKTSDWDHFVFAQQWPQSICIINNITKTKFCDLPDNTNTWTIHGLWPTEKATENPNYCNQTDKFDPSKLTDIMDDLNQFWPSLYNDEPTKHDNTGFWKHEWEKHGTCATGLAQFKGEHNYFKTVLALNKKLDILKQMNSAGVVPSDENTYGYTDFQQVFQKQFGALPDLSCVYDKKSQTQYLAQIEMCISKNLEVIDCPKSTTLKFRKGGSPSPCWDSEDLAYPVITHNWSPGHKKK